MLANEQIRRAVKLDPNNREYRQAQQQFQMAGQAYQQQGQSRSFTVGVDPNMICCGLCLGMYGCSNAAYFCV